MGGPEGGRGGESGGRCAAGLRGAPAAWVERPPRASIRLGRRGPLRCATLSVMDGTRPRGARCRPVLAAALAVAALAPRPAAAQAWVGGRTTPRLTEIVALDRTGEADWPYGAEDLAGDGIDSFTPQEQAIDLRTAYAVADAQRLWARAYVSDPNALGGNVTVFLFIDADRSALTGGTAQAPEIDPRFTSDPSPGGFEYAVGVQGSGALPDLWAWQEVLGAYEAVQIPIGQAMAEAGQDVDPILLHDPRHGYVQARINLELVGLSAACEANLFLRSVSDAPSLGDGDLDVGQFAPCVPADADGDDVPDVIVPPGGCASDGECPGGGICEDGQCVLAVPCATDTDCVADEQCSADGRCVPRPSGMCSTSAECGDLICSGGQCGPCTLGGTECATGSRCAPTGHCIVGSGPGGGGGADGDGFGLAPGDEVRGGACACAARPAPDPGGLAALFAAAGLAVRLRRRPRRRS